MDKDLNPLPLISVVMCVYNAERYIAETIESVLSQTYRDFEFIIWNDGSTDNTESVILRFTDSRIVYAIAENQGLGGALQAACSIAKGKYIARIDADDICMPERFQLQIDYLEKHPKCVALGADAVFIDDKGVEFGRYLPYTTNTILQGMLQQNATGIIHPASMFHRTAFIECGGYPRVTGLEDLVFWKRISKYGELANLPEVLLKYRRYGSSVSNLNELGPYSEVICGLIKKIVSEYGANEHDLKVLNQLVFLNRQQAKLPEHIEYAKTKQELIYFFLSCIIGKTIAAKTVIALKNCFGYFKYRFM